MARRGVAFLLAWAAIPGSAQPGRSVTLADADRTIQELRAKTKDLTEARRRFLKRLDEAIGQFDRGSRNSDGIKLPGADTDLSNGPRHVMSAGVRKFFAARMLATRGPERAAAGPEGRSLPSSGGTPAPVCVVRSDTEERRPDALAEMNRLQDLIAEAKLCMDASQAVVQGLLVVPARELKSSDGAEWKPRHNQLLKARARLEEAILQAYTSLPVDVIKDAPLEFAPDVPIRLARDQPVTLVAAPRFRMALTDSGIEDESGLRLFYQEEWIQRGPVAVHLSWRVGVDTRTGEHRLLQRYEPRRIRGAIDELFKLDEFYRIDGFYRIKDEPGFRPPAEAPALAAER